MGVVFLSKACAGDKVAFRCPQCLTPEGLEIEAAMELPPDRQTEEITLQVIGCRVCGFRGLAVYEEARGSFHGVESFKHIGYWVSADAVESVSKAIINCPDAHNRLCECASHTALGQKNLNGEWRGLLEMQHGHTFLMRMAL
jgi:hypothetical protein